MLATLLVLGIISITLIAAIIIAVVVVVLLSKKKKPADIPEEVPDEKPLSDVAAEDLKGEEAIDILSDGSSIGADVQFGDTISARHTSLDDFDEIGGVSDSYGDEGETMILSSEERIMYDFDENASSDDSETPLFADDEVLGSNERHKKETIFYGDDTDTTASLTHDSEPLPPADIYRIATDEKINITKPEFSVGKSQNADYTVKGNNTISRVHVVIIYKDGRYYAVDNHSSNHTYVNEKMLEPDTMYELRDGDKVVLSSEVFTFHRS